MKKRLNYTLPLLFALIVAFGMFVGARFSKPGTSNVSDADPESLFQEVLMRINRDYVDKPDSKKLTQAAIEGMLRELDPHSAFIPAEEVKHSNEELEGNFEGIGVEFNILNDTIIVVSPISGGPSEQLGIRAGDRIVKIDGKKVAGVGFKNENVFKSLRGPKGSKVTVSIYRPGNTKLVDYTITRDKIPIYSVDASYMAAPGIGYIKINRFGGTTTQEFDEAFDKLQKKGMTNLIIDLRSNPGGYLKTAIELAEKFLSRGKLILYTQGRARDKDVFLSRGSQAFNGKVAIMIDEGSASASEIVSGALQDWDRALIVGRRSFGKGLVQEPFTLSDGSQLRLTVARYYTPSGRCIQKSYKNGIEDYYEDFARRFKSGELESKDSIKVIDSLKYYTKISKRLVYGGGGIVPDVFVPWDTSENTPYLQKIVNKGIINEFVISYLDKNRETFNTRYKDFETFNKNYSVDKTMTEEFIRYGEKNGVKRDDKAMTISGNFIKTEIKALIARQLFHNDAFFEVINQTNNTYKKALETLQDDTFDKMHISEK
jgi:carboxyl-terminal processing protease